MQNTRITALLLALVANAGSGQTEPKSAATPIYDLEEFSVIGSKERVFDLPGSGLYFDSEDLDRFKFTNINNILLQSPGITLREEDGFGIFPNISIRGVDTNRSGKVTLMEDGVLSAPAPYSAPSAYYAPTAGRMSGIEVLKGSSQIQHGPHTTGGVINYISTPIPETTRGILEASYGNHNSLNTHLWYGGKTETEGGTFGALVEIYRDQSDGFREIQPSVNGAFAGSDDTGFERGDYMVKLSFEPNWERRNYFELKVGYSDLDADQTYLGLAPADLANDPWQQYAATAGDQIETAHFRTHLRHFVEFDTDSKLTTTLYYNSFARDWLKLDKVGTANAGASENAAQFILSNRNVLNGTDRGDFKIKSNDREYDLYGIQSKLDKSFETGDWQHQLTLGARLHADKIDRFQDAFEFTNVFAGDFDFSNPDSRTFADDEGDREQETVALALFLHDRIERGNWTFTPGIRFEHLDWDYIRRDGIPPATGSGDESALAYGLGFEYELNADSKLFGGYHRGYSLPSPGGFRSGLDEEISDTFEIGYRYQSNQSFYSEAVLFFTKLQDLVVEDNLAGGSGIDENAGDVETLGLELLLGDDLSSYLGTDYRLPVRLAFTYTDATLDGDIRSASDSFIFEGDSGNQVPYVPEVQINFTAGIELEKLSAYANVLYVDERYASALNQNAQRDNGDELDARFGALDAYVTVDLSAFYQVNDNLEVFARASNLFEEKYVSSRLPLGPRAGAPRLFSAGFTYQF